MLMFDPLRKYARFKGRARRAELGWWWLFTSVITLPFLAVAYGSMKEGAQPPLWVTIVLAVLGIGLFLPNLALLVRRLHDVGWSGFTIVGFWLFAMIIAAVDLIRLPQIINLALWALYAMVTLGFLYVLLLQDGERGPNDYGPDPKGRRAEI